MSVETLNLAKREARLLESLRAFLWNRRLYPVTRLPWARAGRLATRDAARRCIAALREMRPLVRPVHVAPRARERARW